MLGRPTCPHCKHDLQNITLTVMTGHVTATQQGKSRNLTVYSCPSCNAVLNCEIDPIALRTEIVEQVVEELMKRLRK